MRACAFGCQSSLRARPLHRLFSTTPQARPRPGCTARAVDLGAPRTSIERQAALLQAPMALPLLARSCGGAALRQLQRRQGVTLRLSRVPFRCMAAKGGKGGKEKEESERRWRAPWSCCVLSRRRRRRL